jgi:hypothetical protein
MPVAVNLEKIEIQIDGKRPGFSKNLIQLLRSKVPGGWLVVTVGGVEATGVTFLPDPDHEWGSTG